MTDRHQSERALEVESPQKTFAKALLFVEDGSEARTHADQALTLLAVERPELRSSIYKQVRHGLRPSIGALFTPEEAASRISERSRLEPFTIALIDWIYSKSPNEPCSLSFRQRDLDGSDCSRVYRDSLLAELRAIGVTEPSAQKHMHHLTAKGVAAYKILKSKNASSPNEAPEKRS
jgi:hypothetical protein